MRNIAVYLMGGFGNQLFQYLHALKLKNEGHRVHLLADWFVKQKPVGTTLRDFHLYRLPQIEIPIVFASDFLERGCILSPFEFKEFDEKLIQFKVGYFQSASEIPDAEILKDFYMKMPVNSKLNGLTAIHIRLGDYVKLGWSLPVEYYDSIAKKNPNTTFIVFCEDEIETRKFLKNTHLKNYIFAREIDHDLGVDPISDFIAMGSSEFFYGSNSTFSYLAGLAVGFRGGSYTSPDNQYWDWFDRDGLATGKSLLSHNFIVKEN